MSKAGEVLDWLGKGVAADRAPLPHLNAEARRFYAPKPDILDAAEAVLIAAIEVKAAGETILFSRSAHPNAMADLRAAHAAIGRQIQIMESGNG